MSACDSLFSSELAALAQLDPALQPVMDAAGPLPARAGRCDFEGLASTVVSQLVSRQSAEAIFSRLVRETGGLTPEAYLAVGRGQGPRLGLTAAKADTLVRAAEAILAGKLDLSTLAHLETERALEALRSIKGIGPWTAEVHLLFNAGHSDIFPAGDLALRLSVASGLGLAERPNPTALKARALAWAPYRSVAARLFWAYYGRVVRPGVALLP